MYCPKCKKEIEGDNLFCGTCGTELINRPKTSVGLSMKIGDAAAIAGDVSLSDSHNITNVDSSVHNTHNVSNVTNNVTNMVAPKSPAEIIQDHKNIYLNACKRAYEDNILEPHEKAELDDLRLKLGIDEAEADRILETVRLLSFRSSPKTELTGLAKIKLKQLTEALKKNEMSALMRQIETFESLAGKFQNEELQYKYNLVMAALKPEKCIDKFEHSKVDNYWKSFWTYFAYLKTGQTGKASEILFSLEDKFPNYPADNAALLGAAGAYILNGKEAASDYLMAVDGSFTNALRVFADSVYYLIDPDTAKEMGATEQGCAFYLINFFKKETTEVKQNKAEQAQLQKQIKAEQSQTMKSSQPIINGVQRSDLYLKWTRMVVDTFKIGVNDIESFDDVYSVIDMLIPPALGNHPIAMAMLVSMLSLAENTHDRAAMWATKLMTMDPENQDPDVLFAKGEIYEDGTVNYEKNINYAIAFYKAAVEKGNMDAVGAMAELYYKGEDVPQNYKLALTWAKIAYDVHHPAGLYIFGMAYFGFFTNLGGI